MSNFPQSLEEELKQKRVVPFVGAGVSRSVKNKQTGEPLFLNWREFVEILAKELRRTGDDKKIADARYVEDCINLEVPKYLEAIGHAKKRLGDKLWYKCLEKSFGHSRSKADENSLRLSKLIWELSNNLIITTNVDKVFEWTCPESGDCRALDVQKVEYGSLLKEGIPKRPTVWHLHGHIDNKENVIFTGKQYEAFYKAGKNEAKLRALLNFLVGRTFLFIGFSLDDDFFREQLKQIDKIYRGGAGSFYILLHEEYKGSSKIPRYVNPIYFADFGEPLEKLIENMTKIQNKKEKFKKGMTGYWEYRCRVKGGTFDGKEIERGGVMDIKVIDDDDISLDAEIKAQRIWSREKDKEKKLLATPLHWKAEGTTITKRGKLEFTYTFNDVNTSGRTEDTFTLNDDFSMKNGTFVHTAEAGGGVGHKVRGEVEIKKMTDKNDLSWAPAGAKYIP